MLIIFGLREVTTVRDSGTFFCRVCDDWCPYEHRVTEKLITLFFINTHVPTGDPIERINCLSCCRDFDLDVLRYNPDRTFP